MVGGLELCCLFLAVAAGFAVCTWLFPERCPRCRVPGIRLIGVGEYSCRDVWGYRGGSYSVHRCHRCSLCLLKHRRGKDEVPVDGWSEAADRIVFGNHQHVELGAAPVPVRDVATGGS